jgi:hypothetical protein
VDDNVERRAAWVGGQVSVEVKLRPSADPAVSSSARTELAIVALIFCVGSWAGVRAVQMYRTAGGAQYFYQPEFGPAVMLACGRGFENPDTRNAPAFAAFLSQQSDTLDCATLPSTLPVSEMNPFQSGIRYLEIAVALAWKITGVSWSRLAILPGALFGAVASLTYGILRLILTRIIALVALVLSVTSTPNFMQVPQLRDYAKGPFLLAVILIMGVVVLGPTDRRRAIGLSALAGAVVGLGFGFRADVAIALAPFATALAFLSPPTVSIPARITAFAVFVMTFVVIAFPVLNDLSKGGNNGHVVMLGLVSDFDGPLRIDPSMYEFGARYLDSLAFATINSYAIRIEGRPSPAAMASTEYERAATAYLKQIAVSFPADVVTRVTAAIRVVPKYFLDSSLYAPLQVQSSEFAVHMYRLRARALWRIAHIGFLAFAVATLLVSAVNPRAAWLIVLVMIGFAGASAIQFHERHFYYLQFLPWGAFGLLAQSAIGERRFLKTLTSMHVTRAIVFGLVVGGLAGGAIVLSRVYQQRTAAQLFQRYETAPRSSLRMLERPAGADRTLVAAQGWVEPLPAAPRSIETRFIAVRFRDDLCGPGSLPLTIRYEGRRNDADLSEPIAVRLRSSASGPTTLFFVAYDWDDRIRFRGIEMASDQVRCVGELSRVEGLERTPLLLTTTLGADWREERLYQRMR